jgi:hypothetical protein
MSKIRAVPELNEPLVPMGGYLRVPRRFRVEVEDEATVTTLHVEIDQERAWCRRVDVQAEDGGEVTGEHLRQIPVKRYVEWALTWLLYKVQTPEDLPWTPNDPIEDLPRDMIGLEFVHLPDGDFAVNPVPSGERVAFYEQYTSKARRPRRGSPVTDEHLTQVAELYRAAFERGDPPTQTIADTMHVARSTAARWVGLARKRGLLGASLPGRAGEAPLERTYREEEEE